jgi:CheY-like chemotaxis protein
MLRTSHPRVASALNNLARVLVVDPNPASRLTLQGVLGAAGYSVWTASTSEQAQDYLNQQEFELVLSELDLESPHAGLEVLAYARMLENPPATGVISGVMESTRGVVNAAILENVPDLIGRVADMIGGRARRNMLRELHA